MQPVVLVSRGKHVWLNGCARYLIFHVSFWLSTVKTYCCCTFPIIVFQTAVTQDLIYVLGAYMYRRVLSENNGDIIIEGRF